MGSKSFNDELKEQALEHWRDNLRRLRKLNWREWRTLGFIDKKGRLLFNTWSDNINPHIGGRSCPYCQHYYENCYDDEGNACPLYEEGPEPGSCCKEWAVVYNALVWGRTKKKAIEAVEAMIRRLERVSEDTIRSNMQ